MKLAARPRVAAGASRPQPTGPIVPGQLAGDDDEIIDLGEPAAPGPEPEREPVFRIGDTVHTMLKDPPASIALKSLDLAYERGGGLDAQGFAQVYVMREMLGEESYRALLDFPGLTGPQFTRIMGKVVTRAMGAMEMDGTPNR